MLAVCKPRGFVVLYHAENEGEKELYSQLHPWNFTCEKECFLIRDGGSRETNVTKWLATQGEVECIRMLDDSDFAIFSAFEKLLIEATERWVGSETIDGYLLADGRGSEHADVPYVSYQRPTLERLCHYIPHSALGLLLLSRTRSPAQVCLLFQTA